MSEVIKRMERAMELEPDPMKRASMMAVIRQTLKVMQDYFGDEGERRG